MLESTAIVSVPSDSTHTAGPTKSAASAERIASYTIALPPGISGGVQVKVDVSERKVRLRASPGVVHTRPAESSQSP